MSLWNDGTVRYGSRVLTIGGVAFVADNITVSRASVKVVRTNQLGSPSGSRGEVGQVTGSAQLQLATDATDEPLMGQTFAETFSSRAGSETFYIDSVSTPYTSNGETKVNVTFEKKYN